MLDWFLNEHKFMFDWFFKISFNLYLHSCFKHKFDSLNMLTNLFDTSVNNYWKGAGYVFGLSNLYLKQMGQQIQMKKLTV